MSEKIETETVYVTANEDSRAMSEKVQSLAGSIYKEFERVIKKYDEDVVKDLMPLVVGILEALDASFAEKQELDVELELLRDDNEQLLTQYEREKQLRKSVEQKFMEMEDNMEGIKKELEDKVETLESIIRMSEIKSKNTADLVNRLEEKEQESKNEYNKLHERYTELFRTHMDYMERTKVLLGTDKLSELTVTSPKIMKGELMLRPVSLAYGNTIELHKHEGFPISYDSRTHHAVNNVSLRTELDAQTPTGGDHSSDKEQLTDSINVTERATATRLNQTLAEIIASTPELDESHDSARSQSYLDHLNAVHNDRSVFEEIQATDIAEVDFGVGISERPVNPGSCVTDSDKEDEEEDEESKENDRDSVGDNFYGMCRELENLILENTELLATKNALNIVKDDLITKIDVLVSEQEILREEVVILNSVRRKLQDRISQLEEELKKFKEEIGKKEKEETEKEEEEEDVPMAQRKRFTRVEMARVLMERNQYKERLMELQEAVRWTEMMRASKEHPGELQTKKKSGVWNFFGNLFSSSSKPKQNLAIAAVRHSASSESLQTSEDTNRRHRGSIPKSNSFEIVQEDITSERIKREREKERREQYKQVRALVKKDDGRMQAYGWSLPAKLTSSVKDSSDKFLVPVPVPVYCRPLFDSETKWKIWCAAGVSLAGGKSRDRDSPLSASASSSTSEPAVDKNNVDGGNIDRKLKVTETVVNNADGDEMSSLVWVCTSDHDSSQVSVINANNPADILETFFISASHILCIASVPGALQSDYPVLADTLKPEILSVNKNSETKSESDPGSVSRVSPDARDVMFTLSEERDPLTRSVHSLSDAESDSSTKMENDDNILEKESDNDIVQQQSEEDGNPLGTADSHNKPQLRSVRVEDSTAASATNISECEVQESVMDIIANDSVQLLAENVTKKIMSSILPTMWMGTHNGSIYIHSSLSSWNQCLHSVRLKDSVLGIVHAKGRVLVSLADGTVAVFHRATDGQWDLQNYHLIDLGRPKQSIRCMTVVGGQRVWCGYKNKVHIICPQTMSVEKSFDAHPRKESQVRQLCWVGDGVWVSIRLDSTLRLYHAFTHQHLQDVDVEPYVSKMLGTGKLGFSFVRITAMLISCNRLWIGTSNGVIISVPLAESNKQPMIATSASLDGPSGSRPGPSGSRPGGVVRVYSDTSIATNVSSSFIPYCSMAQAQLSFHGHKDAVKFFVSVPEVVLPENCKYTSRLGQQKNSSQHKMCGAQRRNITADSDPSTLTSALTANGDAVPAPPTNSRLILSGGEGYVDFRLGDGDDGDLTTSSSITSEDDNGADKSQSVTKLDSSHIIMWQVTTQD